MLEQERLNSDQSAVDPNASVSRVRSAEASVGSPNYILTGTMTEVGVCLGGRVPLCGFWTGEDRTECDSSWDEGGWALSLRGCTPGLRV